MPPCPCAWQTGDSHQLLGQLLFPYPELSGCSHQLPDWLPCCVGLDHLQPEQQDLILPACTSAFETADGRFCGCLVPQTHQGTNALLRLLAATTQKLR